MRLLNALVKARNVDLAEMQAKGVKALTVIAAALPLLGCSAPSESPARTFNAVSPESLSAESMQLGCAQKSLESVSLEDRIRSLIMVHIAGRDSQVIHDAVERIRPGGLIAMGDNIAAEVAGTAQIFSSVETMGVPLLLAVDQEGGSVIRIPQDTFAAGAELQGVSAESVEEVFSQRASLVKSSGLNTNFGVVADFTNNPDSFIFPRVLGINPESAAFAVSAATAGERGKALTTLKHFPGHGATSQNSHFSLPTVDKSYENWRAQEAVPFQAGIDAGAELVMLGHLVFTAVDSRPASLSSKWVSVLRSEMGFDGIIITDDLRMLEDSGVPAFSDPAVNSASALKAGVTMLLFVGPSSVEELVPFIDSVVAEVSRAVSHGELSEDSLTHEAARVLAARRNLVDDNPSAWCHLLAGQYSVTKPS